MSDDLGLHDSETKTNYITVSPSTSIKEVDIKKIPSKYKLYASYPNPFNPSTKIKYELPELTFVILKVYDMLGNEITVLVNEEKPAGRYEIDFSGKILSSGIYFYILQADNFIETKKMILMK